MKRPWYALWRLPVFVLVWAFFIVLKAFTAFAGLFVVPFLYKYRNVPYQTMWKEHSWSRPWVNIEDWHGGWNGVLGVSLPQWWITKRGISAWSFWVYHAIRNPANGLRTYEALDLDIVQEEVEFVTSSYYRMYEPSFIREANRKSAVYVCWQGWQAGLKYVRIKSADKFFEFKIGWRVEPRDGVEGPRPNNANDKARFEDAGFALKLGLDRDG